MLFLALAAALSLDLHEGTACAGCTPQARLFIEEISCYLDESAPDIDAAGNLPGAVDAAPPAKGFRAAAAPGSWMRALVPGLGVSLRVPTLHPSWEDVEWEIFLFWNVSL
jgi:hypothetical protein